ncbi:MAG: peptide-methionine (S)-S-oxide reductase MsrA [Candidatus Aenigmarchaeota archaeon]|nr:peptide-methionine (S)-S-oxide reductase MsrA [Candidatus Aenigmarchaeota archaeon]
MEKAAFGAGCFWHAEEAFGKLSGVKSTEVGYMGGSKRNPTYEEVCRGNTGHAEVVLVEYDPKEITYRALLDAFWQIHDPTQLNQQGPDIGAQYRSVIFYYTERQKKESSESRDQRQKRIGKKIVTEIRRASHFWRAEDYHQKYLEK